MINVRIDEKFGTFVNSKIIDLGLGRANSRFKYSPKYLEENIEYFLEHEIVHIVIAHLFTDMIYGEVVSWLFDYIDYPPRSIIRNREIPERKIPLSELDGLQSEHKRMRKIYLKKYLRKVVK